jgi:hypothetical protein
MVQNFCELRFVDPEVLLMKAEEKEETLAGNCRLI